MGSWEQRMADRAKARINAEWEAERQADLARLREADPHSFNSEPPGPPREGCDQCYQWRPITAERYGWYGNCGMTCRFGHDHHDPDEIWMAAV